MSKNTPNKKLNKRIKNYAKYSGMGIQMGVVILIGVFAGKRLDVYFGFQTPWMTIVLSLFAVFAAMYLTLKDLLK